MKQNQNQNQNQNQVSNMDDCNRYNSQNTNAVQPPKPSGQKKPKKSGRSR